MILQTIKKAILEKLLLPIDIRNELLNSLHHKKLTIFCPECSQPTIICCHFDAGGGSPDHHDHFCHICLNIDCDYYTLRRHTIASSMVTREDQMCWICGRDVFVDNDS